MELKKIVKKATATLFLSLFSLIAFAQNLTVTGLVKDAFGDPVIGANVRVEGTTVGTITDINGNYTVQAPSNGKLHFSFIGYVSQTISVNNQQVINVILKEDTEVLDEVVVIGYGTVRKKDLTGAVASVSGKDLIANPVTDVTQALQGHLPGVSVLSQDGRPGGNVSIKVRGGGSITQSNEPIFIVDGFPVNNISEIPADQIESIDVLKDASSTAIYGARGANGVILVTTKSAKEEKVSVSYNGYVQFKSAASELNAMTDAQDYVSWTWGYGGLLSVANEKVGEDFFGLGNHADAAANWEKYGKMKTHNYTDDLLRSTVSHSHNLTVSGGSEKTKLVFGVNYINDEGLRINSGYDRWNASLKVSQEIRKNMKMGIDVRYTQYSVNGKNDMGELATAYRYRPLEPLGDGTSYGAFGNGSAYVDVNQNVVEKVKDRIQEYQYRNIRGQFTFNWEIIKGLTLNEELGLRSNFADEKYWENGYAGADKYAKLTQKNGWSMRNAVTLNYQVNGLGDNHSLNLLAGQEVVQSNQDQMWIYGAGYPDSFGFKEGFGLITVTNPDKGRDERGNTIGTPSRTLSWFGRANYTLLDRYLFTATFRADGSTKFAPNNRWGYFPAAAVAWRISDEAFMENTKEWLDNLKLRLSYGQSGADNIGSHLWKDTWSLSSAQVSGIVETTYKPGTLLPNPDLKWETTVSRNIGIDFGFLNRINGSLEIYYNSNKDLLVRTPVDATTGYSYQFQNVGETSNKGIELSLSAVLVKSKDFNLKASLNYNYNVNNIENLAEGLVTEYGNGVFGSTMKVPTNEFQLIVGRPVGTLFSHVNLGYYQLSDFDYANGVYTLKSGVADFPLALNTYYGKDKFNVPAGQKAFPGSLKVATDADGNAILKKFDMAPKHTGGFSLSGNYKSIDFSANFAYQIGGHIYNAQAMNDFFGNKETNLGANHYAYFADSYRTWEVAGGQLTYYSDPENLARINANAKYALPTFEYATVLDNWIEDASYLRLNTLTVGYTFPKTWVKKAAMQNLRVYATAGNLFCLTGYSGLDPEVNTNPSRGDFPTPGIDMSAYPRARTFTFGLNVTF
ncbi:TonB-dependent receptor [Bacteroides sp. 214]|uniref:SusC/RagA family TonB-linked outer membrane protein n=1 Tax=Bacteroides sp. 214 TaxID=2302935 RepID=UPI0013D2CEB1|nr:TonB-dependent receptor [Bacteroides sp. 214]NDW12895.1 TonB-dependent receptor [Bacteroides sp. 214]